MDFLVAADGWLTWNNGRARCAVGRTGVTPEAAKREGDGSTPAGIFPFRRLLYRGDRGTPVTALAADAIEQGDAWCEDPADPRYNTLIKLRPGEPGDRLWHDDHLYDLVVVLGHNDNPVRSVLGSAIFLHLARPDYSPTQGCIAVSRADMERILGDAGPTSRLIVKR